jgi:uncharacterized repeat protein (TIGR01451 family)
MRAEKGKQRVALRVGGAVFTAWMLLSGAASAQTVWTPQNSGSGQNLNDVHFPAGTGVGYVVGGRGTILKTTDGGATWTRLNSGTNRDLLSVYFPVDALTGYAVGRRGTILKTTDGGATWTALNSGTGRGLWGVHFPVDALTGYAVGRRGTILKTIDGGATWTALNSGTNRDLRAVHFPTASTGYAVGRNGTILKTTDAGATWTTLNPGTGQELRSVYFLTSSTGYAVGRNGTILKTTDGGATWTRLNSGTNRDLRAVHFPTASTGYAVGTNGTILETRDGGVTWTPQASGTGANLNAVFFPPSSSVGWAVGDQGTILIGSTEIVTVTPDTAAAARLPSNGTLYTTDFTVTNLSGNARDFDLLTSRAPGTAIAVISITGTGVSQGANPDSARLTALGAGASTVVTVSYSVADVPAATSDTLIFTARSVLYPTVLDDGRLELTVIRPNLTTTKTAVPTGNPPPGTDLTYTITFTNTGTDDAVNVQIVDSLAVEVQFKLGSVANNPPPGIGVTVEYSNDGGATWSYTPVSGGCGAPVGYDACVTHIRWTLDASVPPTAPNNTGNVQFTARIR